MCFLVSFLPADWLRQKGRHWWEGDENGQFLADGTCLFSALWSNNLSHCECETVWSLIWVRFFSSGKGSDPKALQSPGTAVRVSAEWLHTDGTPPQQGEPGQSKDGRPGVQRKPLPASLSCEETKWTDTHQPAAQRLQREEGTAAIYRSLIKSILALDQW